MRPDIALLTQTADFVVKYGFLAVGMVLIFIIAPAIHKWGDARYHTTQGTVIFGLAFIIAYGVLSLVKAVAPQWISAQRVMISGIVLGVPNGKLVQMESDLWRVGQAYTKREFDTRRANVFNFPFLLVTAYAPTCLAVALEGTDRNSDTSQLFNIAPVSEDDMAPNIELVIRVDEDQNGLVMNVWREVAGKKSAVAASVQPLKELDRGCARTREGSNWDWLIIKQAFAQTALTDSEITDRLQSDDVFTRRDARISLAQRGENSFELIDKLLARDDNYRLQLGAIVALAGLSEDQKKKIPLGVLEKVRPLRGSSDKTMRDTAVLALKEPAVCYQEENTNKQPAGRFLVMCYWTKEQCERTRGPNTSPGVTQSACEAVQLAGLSWKYAPGGYAGAWFQFSPTVFAPPFPQLPSRR